MPRTVIGMLAAWALVGSQLLGCASAVMPASGHRLTGTGAPPFDAVSTAGRDVGVPGRGKTKVTLLLFWASWCATCQAALPGLDAIYRDHKSDGMAMIGVSVDQSQKQAEYRAGELGTSFPIVMDESQNLVSAYGAGKVPLMFVIDRAGIVRWAGREPSSARDAVEAVLAESGAEGGDKPLAVTSMGRRTAGGAGRGRTAPGTGAPTLFEAAAQRDPRLRAATPLAERMRPKTLADISGQPHLLGEGKLLARAIAADRVPSMILWGPPGAGKTTLARVIAETTNARFIPFSAVLGGVPEVRVILAEAKERRAYKGERTILFVDEIHRFNKAQQDAFLPHVEDGTVTLIGATTENPSFAVVAPLLSRCKVFRLRGLDTAAIEGLLRRALASEDGFAGALRATDEALRAIAALAQGDARRALTTLEIAAEELQSSGGDLLEEAAVLGTQEHKTLLYDKSGEEHYNVISAFIKSMRGSDPDASIYWLMRMLESGDDPLLLLRRMLIFASEDIGNADPRALELTVAADAAFRRMGLPEGLYPISQAVLYLACAPKSNAVKTAWQEAQAAVREHGALEVPMKLRNAVTKLMREEGYASGYRYAHDEAGGVAEGETYLPDAIATTRFYQPTDRGLEKVIGERLRKLRGED